MILVLLLALPVLAALKAWGNRQARRRVGALVAPRLVGALVTGRRPALTGALFALELAALGCFIVALARPRYGFIDREMEGEGRTLIIAVDTSRSMLAEDLAPNRLQRALLAARDLVLALPNDRIGVIAFAGRAFVQAPLTIDHAAVLETLSQLDTGIIPRGGTNVSEAIELAAETFDKAESANHALIIFTDGDELEGDALATAREAADKNVMIITIGVGTRIGSFIPDAGRRGGKGYVVDSSGKVVRTQLNSERLEQLARATHGLYLRLNSGEVAGALVKKALENLDKASVTSEYATREPIERYRWPLFVGVVLLIASWLGISGMTRFQNSPVASALSRMGIAALAPLWLLLIIGVGGEAKAGAPGTPDPYDALAAGQHRAAIESLSIRLERAPNSRFADEWRFARGTAAFREGDFDQAMEDYGAALLSDDRRLQEQSHYNLANVIAGKASLRRDEEDTNRMARDLEDAIGHYEAALELNPGNADATANRNALKAFLEQLEAAEAQQQQQSEGQESQDSQQGESGSEGQQGQPGEGGRPSSSDGAGPGQGSPGEGGESSGQGDQNQNEGQPGEESQDGGEEEEGGKGEDPEGDGGDDSELEGELKAVRQEGENKGQPSDARKAGGSGREKKDPSTGFSPSEARQLLRALTDEDRNVRPTHGEPATEGDYKDW